MIRNPDQRFNLDLQRAGIAKVDALNRRVDFHALRYTFCTRLAKQGISQRLAQELMRHSDPRLTASIYTDGNQLPTFEAIRSLDWKWDDAPKPSQFLPQLDSQTVVILGQNPSRRVAIDRPDTHPEILENKGFRHLLTHPVTISQKCPEGDLNPHTLAGNRS